MYLNDLKTILGDVLNLGPRAQELSADSPLMGSLPELDSMAVVNLLAALEQHFDIVVHDDEISAANFETVGTLHAFVALKMAR
ncbi:MAG: acyl carrier protein [Pseudomonadota bacterium]